MKFQRNARVFRGQFDAAPYAGVLLLLVLLLLLQSAFVFIPGVRLLPSDPSWSMPENDETVRFLPENGRLRYLNQTVSPDELRRLLAESPVPSRLVFIDGGLAPRNLLLEIKDLAQRLDIPFEAPSSAILLPQGPLVAGVTNPVTAVAINLSGQYFFDSQICNAAQLKAHLQQRLKQSRRPFTLVIYADAAVQHEAVTRVVNIATEAGIHDIISATLPPQPDSPSTQP